MRGKGREIKAGGVLPRRNDAAMLPDYRRGRIVKQLKDTAAKARLCFIIGPIGKNGTAERKHADLLLNAVVRECLQNEPHNLVIKRADDDSDPGMIGDRIITDILNADLVVADLTDLNPNVFYELGIRHSTQKPTIHIAKEGTILPFDNVSHRTIFVDLSEWESILQARIRLSESAAVALSKGYKASNPITQANASFRMRTSEDPVDRTIAQMREQISALESRLYRREIEDDRAIDHISPDLIFMPNVRYQPSPKKVPRLSGLDVVSKYVLEQADAFAKISNDEVYGNIIDHAVKYNVPIHRLSVTDDRIEIESDAARFAFNRK